MTLLNELSAEVCQRARMSRDPRFDGRFFVAVKTTGIFCRPICPANLPKEENVEYFSSQALAGLVLGPSITRNCAVNHVAIVF
ncbi:TPA: metal-binding protein [Vibrio cholerae]|nr:Ada metal-binding domain-containing protein [Vibrio cholerae]PNM39789.1 metal-binding protein [Vibrio cholerae]HDZ9310866.1 metal-binding protein [Vibrio cholerae]HDZ9339839.1 metal-binding protein [Vibrio cholerae]